MAGTFTRRYSLFVNRGILVFLGTLVSHSEEYAHYTTIMVVHSVFAADLITSFLLWQNSPLVIIAALCYLLMFLGKINPDALQVQ